MLDNLNWWEILALLVAAFLIFGDRLPKVIGDGLRMLRNLRAMASNATSDLGRELGTDLTLDDLHPKSLLRKHLLSEEDEQALRRPLETLASDLRSQATSVRSGVEQARSGIREDVESARDAVRQPATPPTPATAPAPATPGGGESGGRRIDFDAT